MIATVTQAETVAMAVAVPYQDEKVIQPNIVAECVDLGLKISQFTQEFGSKNSIEIQFVDELNPSAPGKVLKVEITQAISSGNAFIGHAKYVSVAGTLYENGKEVASFTGSRHSGGGAFAGYKGSCSVLGRCSKALGKDIAAWLKNPVNGARLGDG